MKEAREGKGRGVKGGEKGGKGRREGVWEGEEGGMMRIASEGGWTPLPGWKQLVKIYLG